MASSEERLQILRMIEQGKISAADGATLLRALEQGSQATAQTATKTADGSKPRWLHVQVTDAATGKKKVDINVPLGLVNVGLKMGARFAPQIKGEAYEQFVASIKRAAKTGEQGQVAALTDDSGDYIEVYVE